MELLGLEELKNFTHRSHGSLREIFLTIGNTVRPLFSKKLQEQSFYGLLVDEVSDISNEEQMLAFVRYFDVDNGRFECKLVISANVLEKSASADATTLHGVITDQLEAMKIPLKNLRGLATEGATLMTGKTRDLALLRKDVTSLVELEVIKDVETEVTQL